MTHAILDQARGKMEKTLAVLRSELGSVRAGRATPALLQRVQADYYGTQTPIPQMAQVSVPEPRLIVIQPYDKSTLGAIEKAIQKSDLGLSPTNDGQVIRLAIPQLTEERRRELVRQVHKKAEDEKVAVRNLRREAVDGLRDLVKKGDLSEDEGRRLQEEAQKLTDRMIADIDSLVHGKEKEILEV